MTRNKAIPERAEIVGVTFCNGRYSDMICQAEERFITII